MATLEMVEKLRERANVTYDEAKEALLASGDDLLEAMIYLEKQGKVRPPENNGYYSSQPPLSLVPVDSEDDGKRRRKQARRESGDILETLSRILKWLEGLLHKSIINRFEVQHKGNCILSVPVIVLVLLLMFCFWIVLPLLVIGVFVDCKYRFRGPQLDDNVVNDVMDSVSKVADDFKSGVLKSEDK